jgi:hypothetical protein
MPSIVGSEDQFAPCPITDLPRYSCAHCKQVELPDPTEDFVVGSVFKAQYNGLCAVCDGVLVSGTEIFRPKRSDNPMLPVVGYGCSKCLAKIRAR